MAEEFAGLDGKVALVTGAATGIGEGVARTLHAAGVHLAVADVNGDGVTALAKDLGDNCRAFTLDVTDGPAVEACVSIVEDTVGPIHGLAHVVGIQKFGQVAEMAEADFDATFNVNVKGAFLVVQAVARRMIPREQGSIVAIASTAARTPRIAQGAYCGSKAAVAQLMCVAGLELAPRNIRVNCVSPGVTETGMVQRLMATMETPEVVVGGNLDAYRLPVPLGRLARSEEIADVVAFLLSDRSTYLTMQDIVVDGGGAMGA
ncbi:MAG: SDR family oxidoreductase [Bauldia sp.]|uniref:SDR family oxidoreductase n=1 Tax=Bauldia sp. TaxID=2575872 RepID=UPI001DFC27A0|nr:SDR family oxidoreductase [Bauldia sp.]MCB1487137.1 SDR family oxidoreductase [Bauldia sp.]MCB1496392.1 SDR family oxidoreductase [Bauldia sp.]